VLSAGAGREQVVKILKILLQGLRGIVGSHGGDLPV
jgi:hypothetical protein